MRGECTSDKAQHPFRRKCGTITTECMNEVVFLVMKPGDYSAQITLDFTLCDGLREPPVDWFIKGLKLN